MTAGLPADGAPTEVRLSIDATVVDSTAFPGTVEYTFPAAGTHHVEWAVISSSNVTWTVSCTPAFDPEQAITDLEGTVSGMGLPKGLTTALNSSLQEALDALAINDTASACSDLQSFLSQVNAQTEKKLSSSQAQQLTTSANDIRTQLGC